MRDKYDEAVAYLTENPSCILNAWSDPANEVGGSLFGFVNTNPITFRTADGKACGCLTQIRSGANACREDLTAAIRADDRLPFYGRFITVADLPVFAEWQRRLDRELNRV